MQLLRYQYSNHLGTATLELADDAAIISYEEYYPYGSTSYQSGRSAAETSLKRYRYIGKERDEITGFYYMGARYYVSWMARWIAVDPLEAKYTPESSYNYCHNNPVGWSDPNGTEGEQKNEEPKVGHNYIVKLEDENGKAIDVPDGTMIKYNPLNISNIWAPNGAQPTYAQDDPYAGHAELTTGLHVISEATGGAATITTTLTYRYGWGYNEGNLGLAKQEQTFTTPPDTQNGVQTIIQPVNGMVNVIPLNIPFVLDRNGGANPAQFQNPAAATAQVNAMSAQLQNMGVNNINVVISTGYAVGGAVASPLFTNSTDLVMARWINASNTFAAAGISVTPPSNFFPPNALYRQPPSMQVQIPPTPGVIGWNVITQNVTRSIDYNGNQIGGISVVPGSQNVVNFVQNNFMGIQPPQGNLNWLPVAAPIQQKTKTWEPLIMVK